MTIRIIYRNSVTIYTLIFVSVIEYAKERKYHKVDIYIFFSLVAIRRLLARIGREIYDRVSGLL